MEDVTRVRMFVTEREDTEEVGRALEDAFGDVRPAVTMIVGSRFADKDMKVEIEADADMSPHAFYFYFFNSCLPTRPRSRGER